MEKLFKSILQKHQRSLIQNSRSTKRSAALLQTEQRDPNLCCCCCPCQNRATFQRGVHQLKKKKKNFFVSTVDQPLGIQHGFKEEKLKHILLECNEYNCPLRERLKQELQTYNNLPPLMETILTNTSLLTLALKSHRIHHDIGLTLSWTHDRTPFRNKTL